MKLYIADGKKLYKYNLPYEVRESVLIPFKPSFSKKEYTISLEAQDEKWTLKSNGFVNVILNNQIVMDSTLNDYVPVTCEVGSERLIINVCLFPDSEKNIINVSLFGLNQVTVGNNISNNIVYNNNSMLANHFIIFKQNEQFAIKSYSNDVYLNDILVDSAFLNLGDIIYCNGLKLIYMRDFLKVNNLEGFLTINGLQDYSELINFDNTAYEKVNSSESITELYGPDDYFFHMPRIRNYLESEVVKVESPPEENKQDNTPLILSLGSSVTMLGSTFMMSYNLINNLVSGRSTVSMLIPQIVMCLCMIFGSLIMPKVTKHYQNKMLEKREVDRKLKFGKYLDKKEKEISEIINKQSNILKYNYPSDIECYNICVNKTERLWERQISDNDFLDIALGYGEREALINILQQEEKEFEMDKDALQEMMYEVTKKLRTLKDVPITFSLLENEVSALVINPTLRKYYLDYLILQLITLHSGADLKIVYLMENNKEFDYLKYLNHTWSEDKLTRYFASDITDMKHICSKLLEEYNKRKKSIAGAGKDENKDIKKNNGYKNFSCYYLIITDCYRKLKDFDLFAELFKADENLGFSTMFIDSNLAGLPPKCTSFILANENASAIQYDPVTKKNIKKSFTLPKFNMINMSMISNVLFNIPIMTISGKAELPKSLTFLEMYNVSKIEQLNILNRWETNDPVTNLKTPIGVHADRELFMLDLHEKAHGPHGLIAGSTGSGKSEFIITFVLSMAINFHPNFVQFVLIDYKGGGLAGAFENREKGICLPHLAGTITNLDTAEMNRTLVSINSELKRRQRKFNEVRDKLGEGTIDIYKYQKLYKQGAIKEAIAHLFIISDEFAELKAQQPEFMNELISTARIGRSLGVHLILATQKPSGVVNDQIWANSKFKICLKVQDRADSMEMLKRPEAASIKETGRFYLQVGYDEYFDIGQSGYSGANYIPSDKIIKKVDSSITVINDIGDSIKSIDDELESTSKKDIAGDQLTNTVKYIVDIAKKEKIKIEKLWLSSIPEIIYLEDLKEKYDYKPVPYNITPIIGEYDNPSQQVQGLLKLDIMLGHSIIYGISGSGKENLLYTMLVSSCMDHSPEEVNFYLLDFGAETLRIFNKFPHVGSIITIEDQDLLLDTLIMIDEECGRRKELFLDYGGSFINYNKESGSKVPLLVLVINYYEIFAENNPKLVEALNTLMRDGEKYGLRFVITTATNNSIRGRTVQLFKNKITLQQNDPLEYRTIVSAPRGLIPKKNFGRGLAVLQDGCFEIQTCYIAEKDKINARIRELAQELLGKYKVKAKSALKLPEKITIDKVESKITNLESVPIGYEEESKEVFTYNFEKNPMSLVVSNNFAPLEQLTYSLANLFSKMENTEVTVIDGKFGLYKTKFECNFINSNYGNALVDIIKEVNKEADGKKRVFMFYGINAIKESIESNYKVYYDLLFENISKFKNSKIIILDEASEIEKISTEKWFTSLSSNKSLIVCGLNPNIQNIVPTNKEIKTELNPSDIDVALVIDNEDVKVIKCVVVE